MNKIVIGLCAALLLSGCQTTSPEVRQANNKASCDAYGFKTNTDAYAACMMQLDIKGQEDDAAQRRRIGDALSEMGQNMQQNQPVTCNTYGSANRFGQSVYGQSTTTCR